MKNRLSYQQIIVISFASVILTGALLLCLPLADRNGQWTSFINSLFTATSATCVTGQIIYDTWSKWSLFGQIVIIILIQIGGLGFMTLITMFSVFMKRKIGLHSRQLLVQSTGMLQLSGVVRLLKKIFLGTMLIELSGAIVLSIVFIPKMGWAEGIYNSLFHSVSAFCNAGFDLMGKYVPFGSLITFADNKIVIITIAMLIIIGGIGFVVWDDIITHKWRLRKYSIHSKITLITTFALIFLGTISFCVLEKIPVLSGFFQAVTPRTAGYSSIDQSKLSESGSLLTTLLMLIGGGAGSTAGGIKVTTFAILIMSAFAVFKKKRNPEFGKHRIDTGYVKIAYTVVFLSLSAFFIATLVICAIEPFSVKAVMFEVASVLSTVGLTQGITTQMGMIAKLILISLMFFGRVGLLTIITSIMGKLNPAETKRPKANILI